MRRPKAFAGFLIVGLISLVGFAAFSATGVGSAPPIDLPAEVSGKVAGAILGVDLGPDVSSLSPAANPDTSSLGSSASGDRATTEGSDP